MFHKTFILLGALSLGLTTPATADTTLNFIDQAQQSGIVQTSQGFVRVEQAAAPNIYMLFSAKNSEISIVNAESKSYQRITPERIKQASKEIRTARQQLKDNFHQLPPAQQQRLKPLLDQMLNAEKHSKSMRATNQTNTAAGINCQQHDVLVNKQVVQQVCSANAKALKIPNKDYDDIASMLTMLAEISENLSGQALSTAISPEAINGLPIITSDPNTKGFNRLESISRSKIAAQHFTIPKHFTLSDN